MTCVPSIAILFCDCWFRAFKFKIRIFIHPQIAKFLSVFLVFLSWTDNTKPISSYWTKANILSLARPWYLHFDATQNDRNYVKQKEGFSFA
jgi:hypothetical protein